MDVKLFLSYLVVVFLSFFISYWLYYRPRLRQCLSSGSMEMNRRLEENNRTNSQSGGRILATLESMAEGVVIVDGRGKTLLANSALLDALGLKISDTEDVYFWEVFRDSEVNEMFENCLKERKIAKKEHSVLLSAKTFEIQVSPVADGADFLGVVGVFHDVTRLKELERIRTEFVANVSHELKTPLTSIFGYVETLKDGAIDDVENRMRFLSIIEGQAKNLAVLVEDLLLLSSVESGRNSLRIQEIDFEKELGKTLGYFDLKIRQKKIKIEIDISPRPFKIHVDAALFERVISNLLDNAVKYNPTEGTILVRAFLRTGQYIIEVSDTGPGIAQADLARIFECFYRADKSRSRESGGTGLGLAIAKHIVERHGGKIEAASELQKGSTFRVILSSEAR